MLARLFSARPTTILARHLGCATLLAAWLAAPSTRAASAAPSVALSWYGPGTEVACLGGEALTRAVNEYLSREAISEPPSELLLSVTVERQASGWRALIKLSDQREQKQLGERELVSEGPLCSGLDEPLKLSVALLVDSELGAAVSAGPSEARANPPKEAAPPDEEVLPSEPTTAPEEPEIFAKPPWQFALDASLLAESGMLPSLAMGLEVGFEASPVDWLALRARAAVFAPQTLRPGPAAEVTAAVFYGGVALCPRTTLRAGWTFMGCFGIDAGRLSVTRTGLEGGADSAQRLVQGSIGARLALALGPKWSVVGQFGALLPLEQERFLVVIDGNTRELFEVSAVPWVAGAGASFKF